MVQDTIICLKCKRSMIPIKSGFGAFESLQCPLCGTKDYSDDKETQKRNKRVKANTIIYGILIFLGMMCFFLAAVLER